MKLTMDRREEIKKSLFKKKTIYFLDVDMSFTPEELDLIKKHKWGDKPMCTEVFEHTQGLEWTMVVNVFTDGPNSFGFNSIGQLASAEEQIINNARLLKNNLEAADGFTDSGPREIEL